KSYPLVFGDRIRLFEVFQNLIANAIKFSQVDHPNQISIKAKVIGHRVRCSITDEGIGVDPQYSERVFTLFEQLNPNGHGTGIGLSIVKRIIEIHDGKIWLESKGKNKGCTFYFELPKS
ncbi:MAG: GHKL domain-containing protein, partial [Calditrichaeota bacterium]|nr:GHKL domain-containing protein [Calditrichota bacterium]